MISSAGEHKNKSCVRHREQCVLPAKPLSLWYIF